MRYAFTVAALLATSIAAHADILDTFTVSGTGFIGAAIETGTLTIDSTTALATTINLDAQGDLLNSITGQGYDDGGYTLDIDGPSGNAIFTLEPPDGDSLATGPGTTFSEVGPNSIYSGSVTFLSSVNTAVPEPGPLALLATGLLAFPFVLRRLA